MIRISLAAHARIVSASDGMLGIEAHGYRMNLVGFKNHAKILAELQDGPVAWDDLPRDGSGNTDPEIVLAFHRLAERQLVKADSVIGTRVLLMATSAPGSGTADFQMLDPAERYVLSRFAYLRRSGPALLLESGSARWPVIIREPALVAVIAAAASPVSAAEAVHRCSHIEENAVRECLRFLAGVGAVMPLRGHDEPEDERIPELAQREFHDVLMHAHSRRGLTAGPVGGVFPFAGKFEPTRAIRQRASDTVVPLYRPDLDALVRDDMPLARAMECRRSVRQFSERHITAAELGEFLFRVGRVRAVRKPDPDDDRSYEITNRTYPSGGATYDLEIYVTAWHCEGLDRGLYHYEPADHALSLVTARQSVTGRIMHDAYVASGREGVPQAVITLASRFNRLAWKYRGISYATTLKNVGVLYEAMYLAATAMGLAPCGLGGGDSALFGEATGLDPLVESSVGEFMLGVPAQAP